MTDSKKDIYEQIEDTKRALAMLQAAELRQAPSLKLAIDLMQASRQFKAPNPINQLIAEVAYRLQQLEKDPEDLSDEEPLRVRTQMGEPFEFTPREPKTFGDPAIGKACPACDHTFRIGDTTVAIILGPGGDLEAQQQAAQGEPYDAVALEVHYRCATGRKP